MKHPHNPDYYFASGNGALYVDQQLITFKDQPLEFGRSHTRPYALLSTLVVNQGSIVTMHTLSRSLEPGRIINNESKRRTMLHLGVARRALDAAYEGAGDPTEGIIKTREGLGWSIAMEWPDSV